MIRRSVVIALVLLVLPAQVLAHGEHGAAKPLASTSVVTVGGYQIELLSDPAPLAAGRESRVIAKVFSPAPLAPVSGATVHMALGPAGTSPVARWAVEVTWAGSYAASFTPARSGGHYIRVVVTEVPGRSFEPPLAVDFQVDVVPAPGLGWTAWMALLLASGIALLGLYAVALRARTGAPLGGALDLLSIPWLRRLLTSAKLQPSLQLPLLVLMAIVVYLGFADVQDGGTNLATKLTWTIWWAGIIFTFVLAGRVWCLACPFGALNEWASRLSDASRNLPRPLRNIWWATAMFVLLTWADEQLGVVRSPRVTAWIVVFFATLALAVGLLYARRSFCRYLCPIGGLIGVYSMTAPLELRVKDRAACQAHRDKECYRGGAAARGCPMFEFPQTMDRNNYCNLCAECVRGCSRDNLVLRFRAFGKDLWASSRRVLDESYLAVALVGLTLLVTAQMLTAWPDWVSGIARWLPTSIRTTLKPVTYLGLVESGLLLVGSLVVGPLLVLAGAALSTRLAGEQGFGLRRSFVVFGYMFIPIGLATHLAHNLSHLLLEGSGIVPAVQRTVMVLTPFSLGEPDWRALPLASEAVVGLFQMVALVGFFALSLLAGHRLSIRAYADRRTASRALVPFAVLSLIFTVAGIVLLQQPMGMRHGM
ncbi:MAG: 4Fe-4S binding protein [Candidatus Rokubacteria bacterium]|nr:4Fe-4S binding protein [Candidatus Rokubacteria bacterium]